MDELFISLFDMILTSDIKDKHKILKLISKLEKEKKIKKDDVKHLKKLYGKGIYQDVANVYRRTFCPKISRPLEGNELHPLCANFLGPYTKIKKYKNYPSVSPNDECAKEHDIAYLNLWDKPEEEKQKLIRKADDIFLKCIEKHKKSDIPLYLIGKAGIESKKFIEDHLPIDLGDYKGKKGGCIWCNKGGCIDCGGINCLYKY